MDFSQFVDQFLSHLSLAKGVSEHTLRGYRIDLTSFFDFAGSDVSKRQVRRYLSSLYDKKASTRTVLRRLSALRSFFKHAMREKWVA
jgi:site-specific recombinase XerD